MPEFWYIRTLLALPSTILAVLRAPCTENYRMVSPWAARGPFRASSQHPYSGAPLEFSDYALPIFKNIQEFGIPDRGAYSRSRGGLVDQAERSHRIPLRTRFWTGTNCKAIHSDQVCRRVLPRPILRQRDWIASDRDRLWIELSRQSIEAVAF